MKVLFAVSNEGISEAIVKQYQKNFKEIISYKNVYYFNAILKEIQKDKSYDRIVISEDLEPFANNNYETIDRFLFEKLDSISDESADGEGTDIPIILITTDRRAKGETILVKLFSIGIYNALLGADRNIDEVCKLINKPRTKKDAKIYYKVEADDASYQSESEENVNEAEIQNIITHYKKLGKNTERYVDSFNNIASQYTDQQLKVIIRFLPLNVKAVLEAESPKYQELMTFGGNKKKKAVSANPRAATYTPLGNIEEEESPEERMARKAEQKKKEPKVKRKKEPKMSDINLDILDTPKETGEQKNFIVPNAFDKKNVKKISSDDIPTVEEAVKRIQEETPAEEEPLDLFDLSEEENVVEDRIDEIVGVEESEPEDVIMEQEEAPKKKRGRPKKVLTPEEEAELEAKKNAPKRGRGRPKKVVEEPKVEEVQDEQIDLFGMAEEPEEIEEVEETVDLFDLSEDEEKDNIIEEIEDAYEEPTYAKPVYEEPEQEEDIFLQGTNYGSQGNLDSLLTKDRKIVTFVGATKNGTSFLVNNLAVMLSENGIDTAILDLTKNKNSYYIYTNNDEQLRRIAYECMNKLKNGVAQGIPINRSLTVYTSLPTNNEDSETDVENVLSALAAKHSLVLIDADFDTPEKYFSLSQEIYLVQSMDVLTIQQLTTFLRDLKSKHLLNPEKLRIVINKEVKVRELNAKKIISAMSRYNAPEMTFMVELFDRERIKYCTIPFEVENYERYLETLVTCNLSTKGYTKILMSNLKSLSEMVYPLLNKVNYSKIENNYGKKVKGKKRFGI